MLVDPGVLNQFDRCESGYKIHPKAKRIWNPRMERKIVASCTYALKFASEFGVFQGPVFRFHVIFRRCSSLEFEA